MSYNEYSEQEVIRVINYIGINLPDKSDPDGNVTIKSPLREDRNPSFSINVEKDGVWYDHGNGLSGNLASIIVNYYRVNATQAYNFIQDILADEYPNIRHYDFKGRRIRAKWKEKSDKKPDKTQDKKASNSIQSVGNDKEEDQKNNQQLKFNPEEAKSRLDKEDHQLIETVKSYDLLSKETLQIFDCGIFSQTYNDWLSIPYETGVQLYRRNGGEKSVRMIKGSKPKESWFGVEQLEKRGTLIISKSPRETMLIKQEYGDLVDIISIASGETGALSNAQAIALRKMVTPYKIVKVIFDCDTDSAHKIAMEFTEAVQKQIGKRALRYINIHELTNGECKDVNDLLKNYESDWVLKNVLVKGSSLDGNSRITVNDLISRDISVDDAPRYPDEIYEILPSALRGMMDLMSEGYKKDVFLTSALPVIAAHLPNVKIPHNDGAYSPDYFSILIANPGSGKGVADKAKKLGEELNAHLIQESEEEQAKWEQLSKEERELKRRPKSKKLFLPGNSSSRAVYEALAFNDGRGLIFETEIDSLVNASNQEWGDYSDLLRKTFHHESISLSRKEFDLTISKPELSIFMSGTFDQFRAMFPSAENGYYSRFAFYTFKAPVRWHSHRPSKRSMELGERIKRNSKRLFHIHQHLRERDNPLMVYLEDRHWDQLDATFEQNMHQIKEDNFSEYLQSSNKRLAVIAIRIATIIAVVRSYEDGKADALKMPEITLSDKDFKIGHLMAKIHYSHTLRLYHQLPNVTAGRRTGKRLKQFYSLLPESFQKKEANFVGQHLKITVRSVTNYLKKLLEEGLVAKEQHGFYTKTN